jgi:hypothetical protein
VESIAGITDLGFSKGIIVETIVTTYNMDGRANAAPMGAIMENSQCVVLRIYTSSMTYKNLDSKKCGVVNVTCDAELFYRTAFKEVNPNGKLPKGLFEKAEIIDAPRLRAAEAHIEVVVVNIKQFDDERADVVCDVRYVQASNIFPKAYCRALFATVEAIVHATRVKVFITHSDRQKREQALKLLKIIKECNDTVNRVAPNSRYSEIMTDLNQRIYSWRAKAESLC